MPQRGKYILNVQFKKINSLDITRSAKVRSGIISVTRVVQIVINIKQIRQVNNK